MNEITDDEFKTLKVRIDAFYAENNNSIQIDNGLLPPYLAYDEDTNTYTYTTPNNHIFSINPEKADEIRDIIGDNEIFEKSIKLPLASCTL